MQNNQYKIPVLTETLSKNADYHFIFNQNSSKIMLRIKGHTAHGIELIRGRKVYAAGGISAERLNEKIERVEPIHNLKRFLDLEQYSIGIPQLNNHLVLYFSDDSSPMGILTPRIAKMIPSEIESLYRREQTLEMSTWA